MQDLTMRTPSWISSEPKHSANLIYMPKRNETVHHWQPAIHVRFERDPRSLPVFGLWSSNSKLFWLFSDKWSMSYGQYQNCKRSRKIKPLSFSTRVSWFPDIAFIHRQSIINFLECLLFYSLLKGVWFPIYVPIISKCKVDIYQNKKYFCFRNPPKYAQLSEFRRENRLISVSRPFRDPLRLTKMGDKSKSFFSSQF